MDLITGLKYLHDGIMNKSNDLHTFIHRNISPDTIMVTFGGEFVLGDFELMKTVIEENSNNYSKRYVDDDDNNPCYSAPEIFTEKYDSKVDLWSLGCVIYEMCTTDCLFTNNEMMQINEKNYNYILENKFGKIPLEYSNDLKKIIINLLKFNPNERWNCKQILESKYITDFIKEGIIVIIR